MYRVLVIGFMAMEAVDGFLTLWATNNGAVEINPVMAPIAHTWAGPAVKLIPALVAVWLVGKIARRYPVVRVPACIALAAAILSLGFITATNIVELT